MARGGGGRLLCVFNTATLPPILTPGATEYSSTEAPILRLRSSQPTPTLVAWHPVGSREWREQMTTVFITTARRRRRRRRRYPDGAGCSWEPGCRVVAIAVAVTVEGLDMTNVVLLARPAPMLPASSRHRLHPTHRSRHCFVLRAGKACSPDSTGKEEDTRRQALTSSPSWR